jgi:thioredoxin reductase (NADPH)
MNTRYGLEKRTVQELELVIVGAGGAGLTAAIYASLLDINYLLIDAEAGGGLINIAKSIENYPGLTGIRGPELVDSFREHLQQVGGELHAYEPAEELCFREEALQIQTNRATYRPRSVIIATGLEVLGLKEEYGLSGEREYLGKGVSYCAECDGPLFKGKTVMVIGNPFDAFLLRKLAATVYFLGPVAEEFINQVPREIIEANDISYLEGRVEKLEGEQELEAVVVEGRKIAIDGLFITRIKASSEIFAGAGLKLDDDGFIVVNRQMATNIKGVYAAGDITGEPWQIAKSVGEGAVATLSVFRFLTGQRMRNLGWALQDEWEA